METNLQKIRIKTLVNAYHLKTSEQGNLEKTNKKGLTTSDRCKPFIFMVGSRGFEPRTSTV